MARHDQDWVTILEASASTKVSVAAIRDWRQRGSIDSMTTTDGAVLVSLPGVTAYARGDGRNHLHDERGRMSRSAAEQRHDSELDASLNEAVNELQGMARDRLETN
jgi:hypothetical protein